MTCGESIKKPCIDIGAVPCCLNRHPALQYREEIETNSWKVGKTTCGLGIKLRGNDKTAVNSMRDQDKRLRWMKKVDEEALVESER